MVGLYTGVKSSRNVMQGINTTSSSTTRGRDGGKLLANDNKRLSIKQSQANNDRLIMCSSRFSLPHTVLLHLLLQWELGTHFSVEKLMQMVIETHQGGHTGCVNNKLSDQRLRDLVLSHSCCLSLGKLLKLSEFSFPLTQS